MLTRNGRIAASARGAVDVKASAATAAEAASTPRLVGAIGVSDMIVFPYEGIRFGVTRAMTGGLSAVAVDRRMWGRDGYAGWCHRLTAWHVYKLRPASRLHDRAVIG